jgi:hypothetical protein
MSVMVSSGEASLVGKKYSRLNWLEFSPKLARLSSTAIINLLARAARFSRRGGRVAEGGGLLNRYTVKSCIGGSNPPLSANKSLLSEKLLARSLFSRI